MASNNDCGIRDFDMERFQLSKQFSFPWPVNVSISWECTNDIYGSTREMGILGTGSVGERMS